MSTTVWNAPTSNAPISAEIRVPGSKSQTNRALVLASLADGPCVVRNPLIARDTLLMKTAIESLGVTLEETQNQWIITPHSLHGAGKVDCGLAGTVMRFLPVVASLATGDTTFDGDLEARMRPMSVTLDSLRQLGVEVESHDNRMPFTVHGQGKVTGSFVEVDASASSQFVSALLLAGARFENGIEIHHNGDLLPSLPHIDMSISMLQHHGVEVISTFHTAADITWKIAPTAIQQANTDIEPDLSNALPFLAAAMVSGGCVTIKDWPEHSTQPGWKAPMLLQKMGARFDLDHHGLTLHGPDEIQGLEENLSDVGELTPVLAALCVLADSPSHLYGISHLRGHETNRLEALTREFAKCGANIVETTDGLKIEPAPLHAARIDTYNDHRMVMAGSVLGLSVSGIEIVNPETVSKTLPEFQHLWNSLVGNH